MLPHNVLKCSNDARGETHFTPESSNNQTFFSPRELNFNNISAYDTTDIHPLGNLRFVAIAELPQDSQAYIAAEPDTLLDYHIYAEYYPYIAVDADIQYKPHEMPEPVQSVFADIVSRIDIDSPYNQNLDYYIDI